MDFARVHSCVVCPRKHNVSMIQKKKMLISYVDSNIDIIQDMSKYQCLNRASPENQFLTTRLQYRTLKYLCAICSILLKLFRKHSVPTNYKIMYTGGPLNCYQRSDLFTELTKKIVKTFIYSR